MGIIMKARLVLACAAAGLAASAFYGPTASAEDYSGSITFSPETVEPGYDISITATCNDPHFSTAPIISPVLEPASITRLDDGRLAARTKVKADATAKVWPV